MDSQLTVNSHMARNLDMGSLSSSSSSSTVVHLHKTMVHLACRPCHTDGAHNMTSIPVTGTWSSKHQVDPNGIHQWANKAMGMDMIRVTQDMARQEQQERMVLAQWAMEMATEAAMAIARIRKVETPC